MDSRILKSFILKYDGTQQKLADAMGLSLSRLNAKINENRGAEFHKSEIRFIKDRYKMSMDDVKTCFF